MIISEHEKKRVAGLIRRYRENILQFCNEQFKVRPDPWQEKALIEFARPDKKISRVSLQACAGPGKSAVLAWCGLYFLMTQGEKGQHPKGVVISETLDNLKDNIFPELSKWIQVSPLCDTFLKWTKTRVFSRSHPETWFLSARSFNKDANAEEQGRTLSGVHSPYILFMIDESGRIPVSVLKASEQALSVADKKFARTIQAGNPLSVDGMLYHASSLKEWTVIKITGDPDDPQRSTRIDKEWAEEQIELYGRDDSWVKAYILGEFPDSGINTLFSLKDVEWSMRKNINPQDYNFAQKRLGIDVARFGMDDNCIFPRQGLRCFQFVTMRDARTDQIAARVALAKEKWGSELELLDGSGGFSSGVQDFLLQAGYTPMEINFSSKADDPRFFNKRAEMYFRASSWLKRGGVLPPSDRLKKELIHQTYTFERGKFKLEEKERIRERLNYSPDIADAFALTFAIAEKIKDPMAGRIPSSYQDLSWDYDPLK